MNTLEEKLAIGHNFHKALITQQWAILEEILSEDATWALPGNNQISGIIEGRDAIIEKVKRIAGFGLKFELKHVLLSRNNLALQLHNTASNGSKILDQHLAAVCTLHNGKITAIESFLSDLPGMDAFFASA